MPAIGSRIQKVKKGLTARERALMIYHALCEGREPDPEVLGSAPREQVRELNRLTGIIEGIQLYLWPFAHATALEAESVKLRVLVLGLLRAWGGRMHVIGELASVTNGEDAGGDDQRGEALAAICETAANGPGLLEDELARQEGEEEDITHGAVARVTADALRFKLPETWGHLLALEKAHREALARLEAPGVMPEEMRACMEAARSDLEMAAAEARWLLRDLSLPDEPDERVYELLWEKVFEGR